MIRKCLLLSLIFGVACHAPPVRMDPAPSATRGVDERDVFMDVLTAPTGDGEWQRAAVGATLVSHTQFSIRIAMSHPGYAFVGQRGATGTIELLHPSAAASPARIVPGTPLQLPARAEWFTLDDHVGPEALLLAVLPEPNLSAAVQRMTELGEAACVSVRDPPPPDVKVRDRGSSVQGKIDDSGAAVLCFPFHHR